MLDDDIGRDIIGHNLIHESELKNGQEITKLLWDED